MIIFSGFVTGKLCIESDRVFSNVYLSCWSVVTLVGDLKFSTYKVLVLSNYNIFAPEMLACKQAIFLFLYTVE